MARLFFASFVTIGLLLGMVCGVVLAALVYTDNVNLGLAITITIIINAVRGLMLGPSTASGLREAGLFTTATISYVLQSVAWISVILLIAAPAASARSLRDQRRFPSRAAQSICTPLPTADHSTSLEGSSFGATPQKLVALVTSYSRASASSHGLTGARLPQIGRQDAW